MSPKSPVVLIVFDGCRPDGLAQARTPHADSLWQRGAYTWRAQSVTPSYTLPTHNTMFRSVAPAKHGVVENTFNPAASAYPSILDAAHAAGLRSEEHTSELQSRENLVCRLLLEKKKRH